MASLILGSAGGAIGGMLGGPIGALIGRALGAVVGSFVDNAVVSALTPTKTVTGPRLTTSDVQASTEGAAITRVAGRVRIPGQIIWATKFEERSETTGGGRGGGKGAPAPATPRTTTYTYFANFAVGLCEGPIAGIGRIWADGEEVDQTEVSFRVYLGTEWQVADPLIEAHQGTAPAYRGLAYVVFESLPLARWGNRLPQMTFEIFRVVGRLEPMVPGVALLPGNEFGFDPVRVDQVKYEGKVAENRHTLVTSTDLLESLRRLSFTLPNAKEILLIAPWFGTDLRVGSCQCVASVDAPAKNTEPYSWRVSSTTRATARVMSLSGGQPAYGGTPSDLSLIRGIREMRARGFRVTLVPFLMMDIPAGNSLPNPYTGAPGQPAYPWRGRITCYPAPGIAGSPDKTSGAAAQLASFMGAAAPGHFARHAEGVDYHGPAEWSYRRFILHYAHLAMAAGGVDSFLIGSEMIGLTQMRSSATTYPFVTALKTLAADVRSIVGYGTAIGYTADWSEYNTHRPADGSGDLYFHLDPLWSDPNIDFVGIDNYLPLADWRDGPGHLDFNPSGPISPYDRNYLRANVRGGEWFDWYYATPSHRESQTRTPITDGHGKPWVYRQKALREWWSNVHQNRPGGVEQGVTTAWVPQSKPMRFIEMGCPAVDKGANQPNVFPDPKSFENAYPYFSSARRDDQMQRAWLEAMIGFYSDPAANPNSLLYPGRMIDLSRSCIWCWDVRPSPSYPLDARWGDWAMWETGHWISSRMGNVPGEEGISWLLGAIGFGEAFIEPLPGTVDGITIGSVTTARAVIEALQPVYLFDIVESDGVLKFIARQGRPVVAELTAGDLVPDEETRTPYRLTRSQETELPASVKLHFGDWTRADQAGQAEARRLGTISRRVAEYSPPVTMAHARARQIAEDELSAAWIARERAAFALPLSSFALDPGDVVALQRGGGLPPLTLRIGEIGSGAVRQVEAFGASTATALGPLIEPEAVSQPGPPLQIGAMPAFIDGPLLNETDPEHAGYIAGLAKPWGPGLAFYRSESDSGFTIDRVLPDRATIGNSTEDFYSGPTGRWDRVNTLRVTIANGVLSSKPESAVLNGGNGLLLENQDGEWELLQFTTAELVGEGSYALTGLLRGQHGTEHAMRSPVPAGARVVLATTALQPTNLALAHVGLALTWRIGPAGRDIGNEAYVQQVRTMTGKGRRPLSPVHLRGRRDSATGDWTMSWVRRTRIGGDNWDQVDVPLGEASEAYRLDILEEPHGAVLRTFTPTTPSQLYTVAQQVADFGTPRWNFAARVAQVSETWGPGIFETASIYVR